MKKVLFCLTLLLLCLDCAWAAELPDSVKDAVPPEAADILPEMDAFFALLYGRKEKRYEERGTGADSLRVRDLGGDFPGGPPYERRENRGEHAPDA